MTITVLEIVKRALRLCGQTGAPGRDISPEQSVEVLGFLNQLFDGWNAVRGNIFTFSVDRYALSPGVTTYIIGPNGDPAPFVAPRPTKIAKARLVVTSTFPEIHLPMHLFTDEEWADMVITEMPTTIPTGVYNDGASPNSNLFMWGYPTVANDLELWTPKQFETELLITDILSLPPAYPKALVYGLGWEVAPLYFKKGNPLLDQIKMIAQASKAAIWNVNLQAPTIANDAGFIGNTKNEDPYWDEYSYLTGGF